MSTRSAKSPLLELAALEPRDPGAGAIAALENAVLAGLRLWEAPMGAVTAAAAAAAAGGGAAAVGSSLHSPSKSPWSPVAEALDTAPVASSPTLPSRSRSPSLKPPPPPLFSLLPSPAEPEVGVTTTGFGATALAVAGTAATGDRPAAFVRAAVAAACTRRGAEADGREGKDGAGVAAMGSPEKLRRATLATMAPSKRGTAASSSVKSSQTASERDAYVISQQRIDCTNLNTMACLLRHRSPLTVGLVELCLEAKQILAWERESLRQRGQ